MAKRARSRGEPSATSGRGVLSLERGSHWFEAGSPDHQLLSGALVADGSVQSIRILLDPIAPPPELDSAYITSLHRADATVIVGFVVDNESGAPLQNVTVLSQPSGVKAKSNARGFFQLVVPLQTEAEEEASPARLLFEKPGFQSEERQYLELWPNGDWTYRVRLNPGDGTRVVDERETRRRPAKIKKSDIPPLSPAPSSEPVPEPQAKGTASGPVSASGSGSPTNSTIRIPRTIRVRLADNVTIEYVSMEFYVRRSLPAEWINSWGNYSGGTNSLKAGAVASRSYAASYVNSPSSSTYDICATTSCQVYGTATYTLSDAAASQTAGYVVVDSSGNIARSEYSAENNSLGFSCGDGYTQPTGGCLFDPVCSGETRYGHGRGMCQWGTARWATGLKFPNRSTSNSTLTNGYPKQDWKWIVEHYYPTLRLVQALPLVVTDDVKIRGSSSRDVRMCADGTITDGVNCPLVTTKTAGSTGVIIDGPVQVLSDGIGHTWYKIRWNDAGPTIGWTAENWLERIVQAPVAPSGLVISSVTATQINLSWTDNSDSELEFDIQQALAAAGPWTDIDTVPANVTAYSSTGLSPSTTYYFRVRAYNLGGFSPVSNVVSTNTPGVAPKLAAIPNKSVTEGNLLQFTATATAPNKVQSLTDFESFSSGAAALFRAPTYSGSTAVYLDGSPNSAAVTSTFPAATNTGSRVLGVSWSWNATANPWLRLTTSGATGLPNPVIDFTKSFRFNIYTDRALKVGIGARETTTPAGTPIGSDGGSSGASIEWVGVNGKTGSAPTPTRTIPAGTWTTVTLDLSVEPITSFSSGNGVLSTTSGLGVFEHLAFVPADGIGTYNVYLDNFEVMDEKALTYSLDAGAPTNATINASTGVFTWTPTEAQGPGVYNITVRATDHGSPPLSDAKTFSVTVAETNEAPVLAAITNRTVHAGASVVITNSATDSDLPANVLSFSLDPGAPAAATINGNGVFSWTTSSADTGLNSVTVRVTDNGTPQKSDTKMFTINVVSAPAVQGIDVSGGNVTFTWNAIPGKTYRVQYKSNLEDVAWINLADLTAPGATVSYQEPAGAGQRFYRIIALD